MKNNKTVTFSREEKAKMIEEIQFFFQEERDEKLGVIASGNILDFFQDMLGEHIYNHALDDAKTMFQRYMENMEADYYSLYQ